MLRFLIACALAASPVPALAGPEGDYRQYRAAKLVDHVWLLSNPPDFFAFLSSNVLVVEQADGLVVIDSGTSRGDGDAIVAFVRALGPKPVKALVFTHWHNDHLQGASQIASAWPGVRVIATTATANAIDGPARSQGMAYAPSPAAEAKILEQIAQSVTQVEKLAADPAATPFARARYARMLAQLEAGKDGLPGTRLVKPTERFDAELVLDDPVAPVHLRFLGRANTDGDAVAWLPSQRLIATGDIVVSPLPFGFGSYPADWIETLGKIRELGFEILVPGHGLPQADTSYLDRLTTALTALRTRVGALAAQGLSLEQVREKADFADIAALFGNTRGRKGAIDGLWIFPMIENAYKEARGIPIVQGEGVLPGG